MNFHSRDSHSNLLFKSNHILQPEDKLLIENILFINKSFNNLLALIFKSWFTFCSDVHNYHTVSPTTDKIFKALYRTEFYGKKKQSLQVICTRAVPLVLVLLCRNGPLISAFLFFLHFKHVIDLFISTLSHIFYLCIALTETLSADFLSEQGYFC